MPTYLVDVISQHLLRYVIEAREESHALDEVCMYTEIYKEDFHEFSQQHIGDAILSSRGVTEEEYLALFDKDNDYLKDRTQEQKLSYINKIDYNYGAEPSSPPSPVV